LSAPVRDAGLIEVRGIGIVRSSRGRGALALIADLLPEAPPGAIERLPPRATERFLGLDLPRIAVAPFEASAAAKVALALRAIAGTGLPAIME
jgi:hypothetical protein